MKFKKFILLIILSTFFHQTNAIADNDVVVDRISKNLRCLICQGQSIYDSQADFAVSIKLLIKKKLEDGHSEKQIYDYLKNQYGEWISYDTEINEKTYLLWLFPLLLFIFGGIVIFRKVFIN